MAFRFVAASSQYAGASFAPVTLAPFTVSARFYSESTAAAQTIVSIADSSANNQYWHLTYRGAAGDARMLVNSPTSTASTLTTANTAGLNQWHHAMMIERASGLSRDVILNGDWANRGTNSTPHVPGSVDRLHVGAYATATITNFLDGRAGEVGIWNVELTQEENAALAAGVSPLLIRPGSLVYYSPLVTKAQDIVGALPITLVNGPTVVAHPDVIHRSGARLISFTSGPPPTPSGRLTPWPGVLGLMGEQGTPTFTGTGSAAAGGPGADGTGKVTYPIRTGAGDAQAGAPGADGTGTVVNPTFSATGSAAAGGPGADGSGIVAAIIMSGVGTAEAGGPTADGTATEFAGTKFGTGDALAPAPTADGLGLVVNPPTTPSHDARIGKQGGMMIGDMGGTRIRRR